jgi:topoisomerase-4 subunit A
VAVANARLYADYAEGFVGIGLKRGEGELIGDCSDLDDVVVIRQDGILQVSKVTAKAFFGKNLLYVGVWKRGDERSVFNCIYLDGETGRSFAKRFNVTSITRDREYPITKGTPKSRVLYLSANPNGEAEVVTVHLRPSPRLKKLRLDLDFAELAVRGRSSAGNLVTKFPIRKVELSEAGVSTLGARKVWYDETVRRLNADGRGRFLGDFRADDRILVLLSSGEYLFTGFDLSTHFDDRMVHLEKFMPDRVVSVAYFEGEKGDWYAKRFLPEPTQKPFRFIGEHEQSRLGVVSMAFHPLVRLRYNRRFKETRDREDEVIDLSSFIAVKGVRALGNKLSPLPLTEVTLDPVDEALEAEAHERAMSAAAAPIVATGMEDATEADTERTTGESSATELGEKTSIPLPTPEFSIPARDVSPPSAPPELPGQRDLTSSPFKKRKSGAPPEQPTLF